MSYDPENKGVRAERSLDYIVRYLRTEELIKDGSGIHQSRDASADYCAVEWEPYRWLVMEAVRWKSLFGDRKSLSLRQALADNTVTSGIQEYDPDFQANPNNHFDIDVVPSMLEEWKLGRILCKRSPRYTKPSSPALPIAFECKRDWLCSGDEGRRPPTGNVFVEYEQRPMWNRGSLDEIWESSGLAVTQSHLWAIEWAYRCWAILPTSHLKAIANPLWPRRQVRGGDEDDTPLKRKCAMGVLVKLERLFVTNQKSKD